LGGEPRIVATIPPQTGAEVVNSDEQIAAQMTLGGEVWMANCAECHGRTGLGMPQGAPLPDLTSYTDEQILTSITNGVVNAETGEQVMPAFGETLTAEQLTAAQTYARMMSIAIARGMIAPDSADAAAAGDTQAQIATTAEVAPEIMGVVTGQVAMGTAGAALPAELPITLHVVKSDFSEQTFDALAAPDGGYRFEGVPFSADYQYVLTLPYGDLQYVSEIATVDPAAPDLTLPITIYEVGAPEEAIQITGMSMQAMVQNGTLQIIQIASFVNTSDRVYFYRDVEDGTSVHLRVPQGATFLSNMNEQMLLSADGTQVYSIRPVMPGRPTAMHAAFALPYDAAATRIEQLLDYALAGDVEVTVASEGVSLTGESFVQTTQSSASGRPVTTYTAEVSQAAGAALRYALAGTPVARVIANASTSAAQVSPLAYILIGAGLGALLIAAILFIRERMTKPRTPANPIGDLMEQIAALDTQHNAGKLNEHDYTRQRRALKAQLTALMKEQ
jgi:mono/diheme cytochrome c family protein